MQNKSSLLRVVGKTCIIGLTLLVFTCKLYAQQAYPYSVQSYISYKQDTIAFTHCYLADVIHKTVLSDETIIVEHGIITATGKSKEVSIPSNATVIDCTGKTVLPGFVLLHEHVLPGCQHLAILCAF